MKKRGIFSAFEGGHLDASLFGAQPKKPQGVDDARDEPARGSRRYGIRKRDTGGVKDRGPAGRKPRPDTGA